MNTKISRIYTFTNGLRIDLEKIICIDAIAKDTTNVIYIPVICTGFNKPIQIILGHALQRIDEDKKQKINVVYNDFLAVWDMYIRQKELQNEQSL